MTDTTDTTAEAVAQMTAEEVAAHAEAVNPFLDAMPEDAPAVDMADPEVMSLPAIISDPAKGFMPVPLEDIEAVAKKLAKMGPGIPAPFRESEGACFAVAYQAARWGMDPVALIKMAYLADANKGTIGYMAQAIHAVINRFAPIRGGMRFSYGYADPDKPTPGNLFCRVEATDLRTGEVKQVVTPTVSQIKVKNSPLWFSDPMQQLAYYGGRAFARRHYPEVLMGVYSVDEVQQIDIRDITPPRARPVFDDDDPEPLDATFEQVPPTEQDAAHFDKWAEATEKKLDKVQDSRDPRDAPANNPPKNARGAPSDASGVQTPPQGSEEPDDLPQLREWAAQEQARLLKLRDVKELETEWVAFSRDKRFGRLRAYAQNVANSIRASIKAHGDALIAGADPKTGEV